MSMESLDHSAGQTIPVDDCTGNTIQIPGNWTNLPLYAGNPYCFRYRFSPQYLTADSGGVRTLLNDGRLQLRSFVLSFTNTQYFKVEVTPNTSGTMYEYTIGDDDLTLNSETLNLQDSDIDVPIMAEGNEVRIDLVNCSPFPSNFLTGSFKAEYAPKARRIG